MQKSRSINSRSWIRGWALVALTWFLALGFALQTYLVKQHETRHFFDRFSITASSVEPSGQSGAVVDNGACAVCDAIHIAPEAPRGITAIACVLLVTPAEPLRPVFFSDNAILFPLGARAPPSTTA